MTSTEGLALILVCAACACTGSNGNEGGATTAGGTSAGGGASSSSDNTSARGGQSVSAGKSSSKATGGSATRTSTSLDSSGGASDIGVPGRTGGRSNADSASDGGSVAQGGSNDRGGSKAGGGTSAGPAGTGNTGGGSKVASSVTAGGNATTHPGGTSAASCDSSVSARHRALVTKAIDELFVDKDATAIDRYWADPYYQHNPIANSGVSTFRSLMGSIVSSSSFSYQRLLTLADCELAVVYGRYSQTGVIFDMFRIRDDKIMEHWDSDSGQASEVGQVPALDESAPSDESRQLFASFSSTVLIAGEHERADDYLSDDYVEHHAQAATGPEAFTAYLAREDIAYTKVHHVIADGNYVFALSEGTRGTTRVGFYDLFRVEGTKFVEHWDSRRSVPSSTASGLGIF